MSGGLILGPAVSRHVDRDADRRETHAGLGYMTAEGYALYAFRNSFDRWSVLAGREWRHALSALADAAVILGVATGYPQAPVVPVLMPALVLKLGAHELALGAQLPVGPVNGALVLQYRRRLD